MSKTLEHETLESYRKGLICLSQGYGIGAVAYFRRVVEDTTLDMLDLLKRARPNDTGLADAVEKAKVGHSSAGRLELASEIVPSELVVGGVNPFKLLHEHFSRGLHGLSDEQCLEVAMKLRKTFEFVHRSIRARLDEIAEFQGDVTTWSNR